jgi:hypothetical protein
MGGYSFEHKLNADECGVKRSSHASLLRVREPLKEGLSLIRGGDAMRRARERFCEEGTYGV